MTFKLIGALCVLLGCGGFGFMIAASHRTEERTLRRFLSVLDLLECELKYRLTPLPELCRIAANSEKGVLQRAFSNLATELERQISPDVKKCMHAALTSVKDMPELTRNAMEHLGCTLGMFDAEGQIRGINSVRMETQRILEAYTKNQDVRLRSYQTLGLCAGAALAILFI